MVKQESTQFRESTMARYSIKQAIDAVKNGHNIGHWTHNFPQYSDVNYVLAAMEKLGQYNQEIETLQNSKPNYFKKRTIKAKKEKRERIIKYIGNCLWYNQRDAFLPSEPDSSGTQQYLKLFLEQSNITNISDMMTIAIDPKIKFPDQMTFYSLLHMMETVYQKPHQAYFESIMQNATHKEQLLDYREATDLISIEEKDEPTPPQNIKASPPAGAIHEAVKKDPSLESVEIRPKPPDPKTAKNQHFEEMQRKHRIHQDLQKADLSLREDSSEIHILSAEDYKKLRELQLSYLDLPSKENIQDPEQTSSNFKKKSERSHQLTNKYLKPGDPLPFPGELNIHDPIPFSTKLDTPYPILIGSKGELIAVMETKILGKGGFGTVYLGINIDTGKQVAVKSVEKSKYLKEETSHMENYERLVATGESTEDIALVVDELAWGTTYHHAAAYLTDSPEDIRTKLDMAIALLKAIHECHQKGIIHRDIKLENIMWDPETKTAKLLDFGLAKKKAEAKVSPGFAGTAVHKAPEIGSTGFDERSDTFSCGVALIDLFSKEGIFKYTNSPALENALYNNHTEQYASAIQQIANKRILDNYHTIKSLLINLTEHHPSKRQSLPYCIANLTEQRQRLELSDFKRDLFMETSVAITTGMMKNADIVTEIENGLSNDKDFIQKIQPPTAWFNFISHRIQTSNDSIQPLLEKIQSSFNLFKPENQPYLNQLIAIIHKLPMTQRIQRLDEIKALAKTDNKLDVVEDLIAKSQAIVARHEALMKQKKVGDAEAHQHDVQQRQISLFQKIENRSLDLTQNLRTLIENNFCTKAIFDEKNKPILVQLIKQVHEISDKNQLNDRGFELYDLSKAMKCNKEFSELWNQIKLEKDSPPDSPKSTASEPGSPMQNQPETIIKTPENATRPLAFQPSGSLQKPEKPTPDKATPDKQEPDEPKARSSKLSK